MVLFSVYSLVFLCISLVPVIGAGEGGDHSSPTSPRKKIRPREDEQHQKEEDDPSPTRGPLPAGFALQTNPQDGDPFRFLPGDGALGGALGEELGRRRTTYKGRRRPAYGGHQHEEREDYGRGFSLLPGDFADDAVLGEFTDDALLGEFGDGRFWGTPDWCAAPAAGSGDRRNQAARPEGETAGFYGDREDNSDHDGFGAAASSLDEYDPMIGYHGPVRGRTVPAATLLAILRIGIHKGVPPSHVARRREEAAHIPWQDIGS